MGDHADDDDSSEDFDVHYLDTCVLTVGSIVVLRELKSYPTLNGEYVYFVGEPFDKEGIQRYPIEIRDRVDGPPRKMAVKRENMRLYLDPDHPAYLPPTFFMLKKEFLEFINNARPCENIATYINKQKLANDYNIEPRHIYAVYVRDNGRNLNLPPNRNQHIVMSDEYIKFWGRSNALIFGTIIVVLTPQGANNLKHARVSKAKEIFYW